MTIAFSISRRAASRPRPARWWISTIGSPRLTSAADRRRDREADGGIDSGVETVASRAQQDRGAAHGFRLHDRHEPVAIGGDDVAVRRGRQPRIVRR
jgi:hypothetical protein